MCMKLIFKLFIFCTHLLVLKLESALRRILLKTQETCDLNTSRTKIIYKPKIRLLVLSMPHGVLF